jgi:hypothetical protein
MIYAGILLVVGAAVLFAVRSAQRGKVYQMQSTPTSKAKELEDTRKAANEGIGQGSYRQRVEVKGAAESDNPLVAEFSGTPCVWYSIKLVREYEVTRTRTEANGQSRRETTRGSEVLSQNVRSSRFRIRDDSGSVIVDPEGAKIVSEKTMDKFEGADLSGGALRLGSFRLDLGALVLGGGRRTPGYRYEERAVPIGRSVYVLGEANDAEGSIVVGRPSGKKDKFIISVKSEEELVRGAKTGVAVLTACGAVALLGGLVLVALSFFR